MKMLYQWFNKQNALIVCALFLVIVIIFYFFSEPSDVVKQNQPVQEKQDQLDTNKSFEANVIESIINEDVEFILNNTVVVEMGCEQNLMGITPGKYVEECKSHDTFKAYSIGIIEGSGYSLDKLNYENFLKDNFEKHDFIFIKQYKEGEFLDLTKNTEYGFIDKNRNRFLLVTISDEKKIQLSYQDTKILFDDYMK